MAVRVVTDSACDLPQELAEELRIEVVPLTIRFGEEEYTDRVDLSGEEFYAKLRTSQKLPETAAPAPGAFEAAFRRCIDDGADGIVCVNLSSGVSATMQSAENAARAMEGTVPIKVIDSRSVTMGLGFEAAEAARAAAAGKGLDDIAGLVEDMTPRTHVYGVLDTLEYLKKGGRIGGAQAFLGTLLSIKPIIDFSTGVVEAESRQRTRGKALRHVAGLVAKHAPIEHLAVMHAEATDVEDFLALIAEHHPREQTHIGLIGATIGTHAGPGVIGVSLVSAR